MTSQAIPLFDIPLDCSRAVREASDCLQSHQWQTMRSFDLQAARLAHQHCACPHHGTAQCDCQMVVLLLYGQTESPLTLLAHGRDNITHFSLVVSGEHSRWVETITTLLQAHFRYALV
ncbi:MAG: hypothetical protein Fur0018_14680 [Anaerolineales bacterium]